jgi:hypothetical protein
VHRSATASDRCLNCDAALPEPRPRFCPACGQETNLKPPTLGEFAQQFGGAYLSTEGALWRTLALLLFRPGELTARYLAGRRKHYVLPLRLYLTISVVVLVGLRVLVDFNTEGGGAAVKIDPGDKPEFVAIDIGAVRAGIKDGRFYCETLSPRICARLERRLTLEPAALQREAVELGQRALSNVGAAMFLLLPLFAALLKLAYLNRRLRYTEHMVAALHLHAFWFLALALTLLNLNWLSGLAFLAMPLYTMRAFRRIYGGRWWPRLARAALVALVYGVAVGIALALVVVWALLF